MKLKIEYIPIGELKPYDKNAKIHTEEQIEQIKTSIVEFGMNDPIGIWGEENLIVEGHGRLIALQELGYEEVPVIRLDELTDEQRRAYTLIHNQTTMNTGFDLDILQMELDSIESIDMEMFDFEIDGADEMLDIDDEDNGKTESFDHIMKVDKVQIILTQDEYDAFMDRYNQYVDDNGVSFGFVGGLLNND